MTKHTNHRSFFTMNDDFKLAALLAAMVFAPFWLHNVLVMGIWYPPSVASAVGSTTFLAVVTINKLPTEIKWTHMSMPKKVGLFVLIMLMSLMTLWLWGPSS